MPGEQGVKSRATRNRDHASLRLFEVWQFTRESDMGPKSYIRASPSAPGRDKKNRLLREEEPISLTEGDECA